MSIDVRRLSESLRKASEALSEGRNWGASYWLREAADAVEPLDPAQGHEHLEHQHEAKEG